LGGYRPYDMLVRPVKQAHRLPKPLSEADLNDQADVLARQLHEAGCSGHEVARRLI
jgi:hypothetical protein